jgi:HK97 family phage prohead protease
MTTKASSKKHLRPASNTRERRYSVGELRVATGGDKQKITGYAAKFAPATSEDLGGFREQIDPQAFTACLASNVDCRALWNHDPNHVLGRTTSGTLRLSVDSIGLKYEIDPPATQLAKDLLVSIERGDVNQASFGFRTLDDSWREDANGQIIRTVLEATLFDVSPVTFPAYPDATSGVRAATLRSCPANLRSKLKGDADDIDLDDADDDDDIEDRCDCDCAACLAGDCDECTSPDCDEDNCDDCPSQQRAAHRSLLLRRLRA